MKTEFKSSFLRDLKSIHDRSSLARIRQAIENVEQTDSLLGITNVSKLQRKGSYYRIRVGEYRLGLIIRNETIVFVRYLNRRDIYKYFA